MKIAAILIALTYLSPVIYAFQASPLVIASHKLVKGLRDELDHDNATPHEEKTVTNLLKKLVTECSSDAYLLINQPGLRYTDLTTSKEDQWPFLRKYLTLASTVVGIPWIKNPIDLDFIENYIIKNCDAETISVLQEDENEVNKYIDTRKRIIRVELNDLPEDSEDEPGIRDFTLSSHDELIRKILRKVPSPHYTIILTSNSPSTVHPIPELVVRSKPEKFELMHDIINHPSRLAEVERNNNFQKVDPNWNLDKNTITRYVENRKKDEIHLFRDNDLWEKHEKLVTTLVLMIFSIFMIRIIKFFGYLKLKISQKFTKSKGGLINGDRKKVD